MPATMTVKEMHDIHKKLVDFLKPEGYGVRKIGAEIDKNYFRITLVAEKIL